jgi:ABC-type oligopeptide transport system ATPase subunit
MPNYDFHNCLSPREFEEFVRDVLQIKEQVPFEISGRGRDGGADLRYWEGTTKIIVQIKCFQNDFSQLLSVLKNKEKKKAKALNPTRYILVISLILELTERDKVFDLFDGLIKTRDDIIDRVDLNNLLESEQYHNVERTYYKLWLSSTNVLTTLIEEVVHRGIIVESKFELEEIKKTIPVFVQNPSFERALNILDENRYILISGEPGIGKTTLGRCLAAYYLQHFGYKEFVYTVKVGSALNMYKEKEKQVFFFDDFWGDIFKDEKFSLNEEKQLLNFIQLISKSSNKILILTSREYVLQQGLAEYHNEQLKLSFNISKCFIHLEDYSDLIKARILFNHLYFSEKLEWDYVEVIANGYERIINHQNYHPRIIENFLNQGSSLMEENEPRKFYNKFLDYLSEPFEFWKDIFMKQTYGARLTALILLLSSQPMRVSDLKESFYSCVEAGRQNYIPVQEEEFESIIAQLEKTMIITNKEKRTSTILVKFQNPSIKDFLYCYLAENLPQYGKMIIQGCPFINQLLFMFKTTDSRRYIDEGLNEDDIHQEKVLLPKNLEIFLANRIISEFDTLQYSYADGDAYEHKPSVHVAPEDCAVRKLYDVVFNFGINENAQMDAFIRDKVKSLCAILHEEDYPFSYDDMVEFPYLIQVVMSLKIDLNGKTLINDYYGHSRFAEHLLLLDKFQEIFPKDYADFKKTNYKTIKREIKSILLDDVDFFAFEGEDERVAFLIDMVYPEILECYELRDSHEFWQDLRIVGGYFDDLDDDDAENQLKAEKLKNREERIKKEKEIEKKTNELIKAERDALLGVSEELPDEEIIEFIKKNVPDVTEVLALVNLFENQKPWYIGPFFNNWDRLSLLLAFYQEEKQFPFTSASFYERLTDYLVKEYSNTGSNCDFNSLVEMFSEFAFDMMENGQIIFSKQNIQDHPAFKHKLETGQVDLLTILSFPFLVQRGKWYEFRTLAFQVYLALKKFLHLNEKERIASYTDFLDLNGCFNDNEHDIWILCSELDLQTFNQYYLIPILKEYLSAIDTTNHYTVCSSTMSFFGLKVNFKISPDTLLPKFSGACSSGLAIPVLDFIDKFFFEIEDYVSYSDEDESDSHKNHSDLLRLGRFILQEGSEEHREDEYKLDLVEHSSNPELLKIFESLGVCNFLWNFYHNALATVEKAIAANYDIRLDPYTDDPVRRWFAMEN